VGRGNVAPEDIVWAGIARSRPRLETWSDLDEDDRLFAHVLVLGPDAAGCADAVRAAIGEHDADFEDFVYLEPVADRVARGVIDPDWAATAAGLGGTYRVSTGVFDTDNAVRPRSPSRRAALWGGTVILREPDDRWEENYLAIASSYDEFRALVSDFLERYADSAQLLEWRFHKPLASFAKLPSLRRRIGHITDVYTCANRRDGRAGTAALWSAMVEWKGQDHGAFTNVFAAADDEDALYAVVEPQFSRFGRRLVDFDEVLLLADATEAPALVEWTSSWEAFEGPDHRYRLDAVE
jgi:hypothetical protein